jgi:hypothetical protein
LERRVHVADPVLLPPLVMVEYDAPDEALLFVPSVIVPIPRARDRNVMINHRHPDAARIKPVAFTPFTLDPRLFNP